jgi:hypothetical protein
MNSRSKACRRLVRLVVGQVLALRTDPPALEVDPDDLEAYTPRYRKVFLRDDDGDVTGFAERREAWDLVFTKQP